MLSIVIPAHNEEAELPATLAALAEARAAIDLPSEVVVVDDASTDATARIAASLGAVVVPVEVRQIAGARNAGARAARGEWLLFVDADTRVTPDALREAVAALREGAVGGGTEVRWSPPVPLWGRVGLALFMPVWRLFRSAAGCFLFARREDFEQVGRFDERYYASEEYWLSRALAERGRFVIGRQPVFTSARKIRMHSAVQVLWLLARFAILGPAMCRTREGLDLWYDGRREKSPPSETPAPQAQGR